MGMHRSTLLLPLGEPRSRCGLLVYPGFAILRQKNRTHKNDEKLADLVIICNEIKPKC